MYATLERSGNNRVITIPEMFFQNIQFPENEPVDVSLENRRIVIGAKRKTLKERLVEFYGEDYLKHRVPLEEVDWGHPIGEEAW